MTEVGGAIAFSETLAPGIELKRGRAGEILLRGENVFQGYYQDAASTKSAFTKQGWFKTGDVGLFSGNKFLRVQYRKRDILVTSNGKKVSSSRIENELKKIPLITQALIIGDGRPCVGALITVNWPNTDKREVGAMLQRQIKKLNLNLGYGAVIKFKILPSPFSVETGELTSSLKLRRRFCEAKYAKEIDEIYEN